MDGGLGYGDTFAMIQVRHTIVLALEPENESVEQSKLLSDALMPIGEPAIKPATLAWIHANIIHEIPPETNICSFFEQCLCHHHILRFGQRISLLARNHSAIHSTP